MEITTIVCEASKSSISYTGDKNGSDNLEQIEAFDGVDDTSDSFWSSSQRKGKSEFACGVNFSTESVIGNSKENDGKLACAIREFN